MSETVNSEHVFAKMEPEVAGLAWRDKNQFAAICSIAISLKRIADAFAGTSQNTGLPDLLHYLTVAVGERS